MIALLRRAPSALAAVLWLCSLSFGATPRDLELDAHAKQLQLKSPVGQHGGERQCRMRLIQKEESKRAFLLDARNTKDVVEIKTKQAVKASRQQLAKSRVLFGFSRMIDRKVTASASLFEAFGDKLTEAGVDQKALLALIEAGPPADGRWPKIERPLELVAAIVHHQLVGAGASLQLSITPQVSEWLEHSFTAGKAEVSQAMGGAGGFGANLAGALGLEPSFHSAGAISPTQAAVFGKRVRILQADGTKRTPEEAMQTGAPTKINYSLELPANLAFSLGGMSEATLAGEHRAFTTPHTASRILLATDASYPPIFDPALGKAGLTKIAKEHDLFVAVGLHYLTGYSDVEFEKTAATLRTQLATMRRANPKLVVHYQYVRPRKAEMEWRLFRALRGRIDSMSLNVTELDELAANLDGKQLDPRRPAVHLPPRGTPGDRERLENPSEVYERGLEVMHALGLSRLHLHGMNVDVILKRDPGEDALEREVLGAMRARQVAVNKVVGRSGEIVTKKDLFHVMPTLSPASLHALQDFASYAAEKHGLSEAAREQLVQRSYFVVGKGPRAIGVAVVPTRQFHVTNSLASLGDTIDITTALFALDPTK